MKWLLSLLIAFPHQVFANTQTPEVMVELYENYLERMKPTHFLERSNSSPQDTAYLNIGRSEFLAKAISIQLAALEPEDFNLFLLYMMHRYESQLTEREQIFDFLGIVRAAIADDLAITAELDAGPEHAMMSSSYNWGIWILLGASLGWRAMLARSSSMPAFIVRAQNWTARAQSRIAAISSKTVRIGTRTIFNKYVGSTAVAAGLGGLNYIRETHRTHKIDPLALLQITQFGQACDLSYRALDIQDRFEAVKDDEKKLEEAAPAIRKDIETILKEADLLAQQFPRLQDIKVEDPFFQLMLKQVPQAKNWAELRKAVAVNRMAETGQCVQMSLIHVGLELNRTLEALPEPPPPPVSCGHRPCPRKLDEMISVDSIDEPVEEE